MLNVTPKDTERAHMFAQSIICVIIGFGCASQQGGDFSDSGEFSLIQSLSTNFMWIASSS